MNHHNLVARLARLIGQLRAGDLDAREAEYLSAVLDHFHATRNNWRNQ